MNTDLPNQVGLSKLLELAEILEKADALHKKRGEPTYDQSKTFHSCGTPACAWGHWLAAKKQNSERRHWGLAYDMVSGEFGITTDEVHDIFGPCGCGWLDSDSPYITSKDAAAYIRGFVARKLQEPT